MAAEPIAVILADAHLQDGAWASKPIRGDAKFGFRQAISYAVKRGIKDVIGAGDLIDQQRNRSSPITFLQQQLDRLAQLGGRFHYVQGQHDFDDPPWLSGCRAADHLHKRSVEINGLSFYGLDFQVQGRLQEELDAIPAGTDVLVAHQVWGDWMGSVALPQGSFSDVPTAAVLVSGDLHQRRDEQHRGKDGQPLRTLSPGATCKQAINEPAEHYFVVLRDDGSFVHRKLRSRVALESPVLNRPEDVDQFVAELDRLLEEAADEAAVRRLPEALRKPLLRVTYSHRLGDAERRIAKRLDGRAHLFPTELPPPEKLETRPAAAVAVAAADDAPVTPLTELDAEVDPAAQPEAHRLLARLLQAADPRRELAAWRAEFMGEE